FPSCVALRSLPSFPTRRSSDLDHQGQDQYKSSAEGCDVHRVPPLLTQNLRAALRCRQPSRGGSPACPAGSSCPGEGAGDGGERVDRKSTRLNSSHVSISYAVFC